MDMNSSQVTVYFDGACPLCSREIEHYRHKDHEQRLRFVDISLPAFSAETEGLDPVRVQQVMHVRLPSGALVTGVDAFVEIWKVLPGFAALAKVASLPGIHLGLRVGYRGFAAIRPLLPKRKRECVDGRCAI
jgi:predicted DCC family thiol-disulfide oxidoreductase YuxK